MSNRERFATTRDESETFAGGRGATGPATFRNARAGAAGAIAEVGKKGREVMQNVREVRDTFAEVVLHSINSHPYAALVVAGGIGFVAGAVWRR